MKGTSPKKPIEPPPNILYNPNATNPALDAPINPNRPIEPAPIAPIEPEPIKPPPEPQGEEEEGYTVDLVSFEPSFTIQGAIPPNPVDVAFVTRRRRRRLALIIIIPSLVVLGMMFGPTLYHASKAQIADGMARQAEDEAGKKHFEEAIASISPAFKMAPGEPEVRRAMAKILTSLGSPGAMIYWNLLIRNQGATDDDRRAAADCAMQFNLYHEASTIIKDLLVRDSGDARNEFLAARWSALRGDSDETMHFATAAANDDPNNHPAALFLAAQKLANPNLHQEGVHSLLHLTSFNDDTGLAALRMVTAEPSLKPADLDQVIARLHSHPLAGEFGRTTALALEIKRHPDQRKTLIDQAVAAHRYSSPADLMAFAEWLNSENEAPRVLKLISLESAFSDKDLFSAYIDAMGVLKRWPELRATLSNPELPISTAFSNLYLSRCAHEMGDEQASAFYWRNAVAAAAHNPLQSLHLAVYAENQGQNERAGAIYRALTQMPFTARAAYLGLLRISKDQSIETLCNLHDEIVLHWPEDQEMVSEDIGLNLLLKQHVHEMYRRAVDILADDPNSVSHHTNVALGCLRLGDPSGALRAYNGLSIDWDTAPVMDVIVYAATLDANGRTKAAHRLLFSLNIDRQALRPELRDLVAAIP